MINNEALIKNVLEIISGYVSYLKLTPNNIHKKYKCLLKKLNNNNYLNLSLIKNLIYTENINYYLFYDAISYAKLSYNLESNRWIYSNDILLDPNINSDMALLDSLGNLLSEPIGNTYYSEKYSDNEKSGTFRSLNNENIVCFKNLTV
jgi:hypothetical protein